MARKRKAADSGGVSTTDYRHRGEKRPNIPPAKIAGEGNVPQVPKARYYYNPHLSPVLRFDSTGEADGVKGLISEAATRFLQPKEVQRVTEAVAHYDPWLEWAGKREQEEKRYFEVDPVALHIHERVSAQAIARMAMREDVQRDFFADPQQPYQEAIQFYQHEVDWANRLILGDSLHAMSSVARRENLAGQVQVIYIDPPYGINFSSNFQTEIGRRDVKERDADMAREPETIRAYRDTWRLGVHSYLGYVRTRLIVARELLREEGSIFVQISDENVHRVRNLLDEVFGYKCFVAMINYRSMTPLGQSGMASVYDYVLWYCKNAEKRKFRPLYVPVAVDDEPEYNYAPEPGGSHRVIPPNEWDSPDVASKVFKRAVLTSSGYTPSCTFAFDFQGRSHNPLSGKSWRTNPTGMQRLIRAERLVVLGKNPYFRQYLHDFGHRHLENSWHDTAAGFSEPKRFVVQTNEKIVERCMLMTSDPGDLVLDPTCGSGTTAFVAERWGRRWITIDSSRVALAIARQRLLTAKFDYLRLKDDATGPKKGFVNRTIPKIELGQSIGQNQNLDPIFAKHQVQMDGALQKCNQTLRSVSKDTRRKLADKLKAKPKREITSADIRRWELPDNFQHWTVPFDTDPDWPAALQGSVVAYRTAWRAKMDEVNKCIADNAEQEELFDQPEVVKGILRVSGPFTVEGVRPEELSVVGEGSSEDGSPEDGQLEIRNMHAYLTRMVQYLRADGMTFIGNQRKQFARLDALFETQTGNTLHAEGVWKDGDLEGPNTVAVGFGPQYGPVTALQVEELIRGAKRYDDLVVAGFSFDAEATEVIQAQSHPKLTIHQAYIRPDINPAMEGLLRDTPNSQLFTVFGQPELSVKRAKDDQWVAKLEGVDIYDPIENTVRSSGADKVAAWFLDSDYDGRCFCITQAFFPDQDAWEKIAKALGSSADPDVFKKFGGTESLPFEAGKYKRIAVKVIDPRGNEVMAVRQLEV